MKGGVLSDLAEPGIHPDGEFGKGHPHGAGEARADVKAGDGITRLNAPNHLPRDAGCLLQCVTTHAEGLTLLEKDVRKREADGIRILSGRQH